MRLVVALVVGTFVFAAVYAAATSVSLSSDGFAAGDAAVERCDTEFTTLGFTKEADDDTITHVTISGIENGCLGGTLTVTLVDEDGQALGEGEVELTLADIPEVTIAISSISAAPLHSDVTNVAVIVIGP